MSAKIIDGKAVAREIQERLAEEVVQLKNERGITPGLAVVLVGNDPASRVYVNNKKKMCEKLGIYSEEHLLDESTSQDTLLALIRDLNSNPRIHGILVQLPLPGHLDEKAVLEAVSPDKDVDGFHPMNVGRLMVGEPGFVPCTPAGIMELIKHTGVGLKGKRAVVIGRSNIVGKPVALLLLAEHATVTICHSRTVDLPGVAREADVLVVAVGKPKLVNKEFIKPGAVVIDVGVNRVQTGLVGDVDFDSASEVAGYITPVPGGVGPMTIIMLMRNTIEAARRKGK
ncbi:MAG TPA: bifunctional methylenetetrahydrofolate dehydrogenase/methenyltetrahydrofolate cyclohydrolase FolD [Firmicutes bacterium]|nr:bifunctional methylenetetrahydrofolate dehydrogenase/methenyltetrahydrofolate cyclohydrolase FolD [Bacillota bacterium]